MSQLDGVYLYFYNMHLRFVRIGYLFDCALFEP